MKIIFKCRTRDLLGRVLLYGHWVVLHRTWGMQGACSCPGSSYALAIQGSSWQEEECCRLKPGHEETYHKICRCDDEGVCNNVSIFNLVSNPLSEVPRLGSFSMCICTTGLQPVLPTKAIIFTLYNPLAWYISCMLWMCLACRGGYDTTMLRVRQGFRKRNIGDTEWRESDTITQHQHYYMRKSIWVHMFTHVLVYIIHSTHTYKYPNGGISAADLFWTELSITCLESMTLEPIRWWMYSSEAAIPSWR